MAARKSSTRRRINCHLNPNTRRLLFLVLRIIAALIPLIGHAIHHGS